MLFGCDGDDDWPTDDFWDSNTKLSFYHWGHPDTSVWRCCHVLALCVCVYAPRECLGVPTSAPFLRIVTPGCLSSLQPSSPKPQSCTTEVTELFQKRSSKPCCKHTHWRSTGSSCGEGKVRSVFIWLRKKQSIRSLELWQLRGCPKSSSYLLNSCENDIALAGQLDLFLLWVNVHFLTLFSEVAKLAGLILPSTKSVCLREYSHGRIQPK